MTSDAIFDPESINRLTADTEPWLSCDDCFEQVEVAIESTLACTDPLPEPFRVHLKCCMVCHEEALSLAALIAPDVGLSAGVAVERVETAIDLVA